MAGTLQRPLSGIKVIEFTHMVMGPTVGLILADLGADVIKIEPPKGDNTRRLTGSGAGYFPMYNRNKRSICLDVKTERGKEIASKLIQKADVFVENFRPGAMDKLGFGYDVVSADNSRLVYCSEKGFLSGPYEDRAALDEVAQMMGGLAYMTGPPGRPLRAGASVTDVTGGMFGAIAILAALEERHRTGKGQYVKSSLYETSAFLVGQHMAQYAVTGVAARPMPARISAWAVYDIFETADDDKVFVGVVSDTQWRLFCDAFDLPELAEHQDYAQNAARVAKRDELIPQIQQIFKTYTKADLMIKLEAAGLPFAPINKPEDLFEDPHLSAGDGLVDVSLPNGDTASLPALPIEMAGKRPNLYEDLPEVGQHTADIIAELGYNDDEMCDMAKNGTIRRQ